jgi:arginine:agmatine antiporter
MQKKLGPVLATLLVASAQIGSGVYLLPASLGAIGSISILSWVLATVGAVLIGGAFSALAIADPGRPGLFCYIRDAFGPGAAFVTGTLYWIGCWIAAVAVALAVTGYLSFFLPVLAKPPGATIATIGVLWLLIIANMFGPLLVARLQSVMLVLGLLPVFLVATVGWFYFHPSTFTGSWNVSGKSMAEVVPASTVMVFWAYVGLEAAIILSGRVRDPARNVPIATLGGIGIAALIYMTASSAIMGILPAATLAKSSAPFADAVVPMLGVFAAGAVALCAMLKASGTLGATLLLTVETAESEAVLGQIRNAPPGVVMADKASIANLIVTGVLTSLVTIASASPTLGRQFTIVTNVVVVLTLLVYGVASLALLRLNGTLPPSTRRWAIPVGIGGALFSAVLIAASERDLLIWSAAAILFALVAYLPLRLRRMQVARTPSGA